MGCGRIGATGVRERRHRAYAIERTAFLEPGQPDALAETADRQDP